jgi:hypothetical protein
MKSRLIKLLWIALTLAVGIAIGIGWSVIVLANPLRARTYEQMRERLSQEAYLRYRFADYETARCAILDYVSFTRSTRAALSPEGQSQADRSVVVAFARVAAAAGRANREADQREYLRYARDASAKLGETPTDAQLAEMVRQVDEEWDAGVRARPLVPSGD